MSFVSTSPGFAASLPSALAATFLGSVPAGAVSDPGAVNRLMILSGLVIAGLLLFTIYGLYRLHRRLQHNLGDSGGDFPSASIPLVNVQQLLARIKVQDEELGQLRREALQRERDTLRISQQVLSQLPSGVIFFDRWGRVRDANPAARSALGYTSPEGLLAVELLRDAVVREEDGASLGRASDLVRQGLSTELSLQRKTMDYATPAGEHRLLGVTMFPLRADGTTNGLICLLTDLTTIRALQDEVQRRRNLSSLGEMSAGIAHEFKNSLATISGYAQMLYRTLHEEDGVARQHVTRILDQVQSLTTVATEFLTFARPLELITSRVDLNFVVRESIANVQAQDFPLVELRLRDELPEIPGDPILLGNVFMNLLRNSCQAIADQGQPGTVEVRLDGLDEWQVLISVHDTGPGVPAEIRDKIFIPFFTTKATGNGLGLAMVHKIVTAHQGRVQLSESKPGHTSFVVSLPMNLPMNLPDPTSETVFHEPGTEARLAPPTVPL